MPNTALNRTTVIYLTNKSGAAVAFGAVVVINTAVNTSFTTTTVAGYTATQVGVVVEPNGIAIDALGLIAIAGWVPRVNLDVASTVGQFFKTHTVVGQASPHAAPYAPGDFGYALQASATPRAVLLGFINISSGGLALSDGDKGDITVSASGVTWTVDLAAITYAKMQPPSIDSILLGRGDTAPGDIEEITLGTGLAMTGTVLSATAASPYTDEEAQDAVGGMVDSSLIYADATPLLSRAALTGDVTAAQGSNALSIANSAVATAHVANSAITNAKLANIATAIIKGRVTAGTGAVEDLTVTQVTALLNLFSSTLKGLVPLSGGGTANYLRADGTWAPPPVSAISGLGSIGKIAYWDSTSNLTYFTNLLYDDITNHLRLGILDTDGGVVNTGLLEFYENGIWGTLTFKPHINTGTYTVTWPAAQGANGSVPTNDGSGNLSWTVPSGGGSSLPVVDTTSIVEGSADATKELRFEVDGNSSGVIGIIATVFTTAKTITIPDATDTLVGKATTDILTNKSIDADTNTITNIENADIKAAAGIAYSKLTLTGAIVTADIGNDQVTYAKIQNVTASRLLGRDSSGGDVQELTLGDGLTLTTTIVSASLNSRTRTIPITFDGGGSVLTTGAKKAYWSPEHSGTITKWRLLADQSGSVVVDIWKDTYANYPPTVADTVTASAKPTITTALKGESSTLTGWTTSFSAGDVFEFNIDSVTSITKVTLMLTYTVV